MPDVGLGGVAALEATRPRRVSPGRVKQRKGKPGFWPRVRRFRTRFALVVGSAGFTAIMIGIVINATMEQKTRHPAPLFGSSEPVRPAAQPVRAGVDVSPTPPITQAPPRSDEIQSPPPAIPAVAVGKISPHAQTIAPKHRVEDGIARLLGTLPSAPPHSDMAKKPRTAPGMQVRSTGAVAIAPTRN